MRPGGVIGSTVAVKATLRLLAVVAVAGVGALGACAGGGLNGGSAVTLAAAGDISCASSNVGSSSCHAKATSELLLSLKPDAVVTLGDNQYESGTYADYVSYYDPTWGRLKDITQPSPGNHEYKTGGAAGYFAYFGPAAGDSQKGYHSFDLGAWHIVALNSNCGDVPGGCGAGSPQETWLKADLAASPALCTLAYWHHPFYTSGSTHQGDRSRMSAIWQDLYAAGAEVVLSGHEHNYERFAPQDAAGRADAARGVVQFVVGTGGKGHYNDLGTPIPNSVVRDATSFGVLTLTLSPEGYDWAFVPDPTGSGGSFADGGSAECH